MIVKKFHRIALFWNPHVATLSKTGVNNDIITYNSFRAMQYMCIELCESL